MGYTNSTHRCLVCEKSITYRFAICTNCEDKYGRSPLGWPEWLRFLWNDTQRERRMHRRIRRHEISFIDLSDATIEQCGIDSNDDSEDSNRRFGIDTDLS